MDVRIHPSWKSRLNTEFSHPYFTELAQFVRREYATNRCYPPGKEIFSAFDHSPFEATKVVIIGQDPYHGPGQAHGLCFSVRNGIAHPPSLVNIFKEVNSDIGVPYPESGDLTRWARQGVLLLNATLTVRAHQAGSHQGKGWEVFTDAAIRVLSSERTGLVFLLWGGYAKRKRSLIDTTKHTVLTSGHPSPLSANRGLWFGNQHFSQTNSILEKQGVSHVQW